jgi:cyclase
MLKKIVSPLLIAATLLTAGFSADNSKEDGIKIIPLSTDRQFNLEPKKVADDVWCIFGALEMPTADNAGFMSNHCFIKTDTSWVLWDTGATYKFAEQSYNTMSKIADLPVSTVIFSHEHDDHWLGANFYKEKFNAKFIGTELINERYKPGHEAETRMFKILKPKDIAKTKIIRIDEPHFKEGGVFNIGGVKMEYISLGQAHSEDDYILYLPNKKLLLAADVVMNGRITSNRNGLVIGQLKALDLIKSKDWDVLVPGHGFITDKTATDESTLYFNLLKDRILQAIEDGVDASEITEKVTLPEFKDKNMYNILNSGNVFRSYGELEMYDPDEEDEEEEEE